MKIKTLSFAICVLTATSLFGQATRDTIFIYDTVRVSVKRPVPPPPSENFFEEESATISKDSIILGEEQIKQSSIMNNFKKSANQLIRTLAVGVTAAISSVTPLLAQEDVEMPTSQVPDEQVMTVDTVVQEVFIEEESDSAPSLKYAPINIGFAYPISIYGSQSPEHVYNFSVGFLTDVSGGIEGIQWSLLYNQVNGSMRGIQWGGLLNISGAVEGIQWGGLCNFAKDVHGIQWAGIMNQSANLKGIQAAGIASVADNVDGVQASGIYNVADSIEGLQASGIANEAKYVRGGQFAGIFNRAEYVNGVQVGLVNSTKKLSGVQIGLFNKVDTIEKGLSIGVFNFLKKDRFQELELSMSTQSSSSSFHSTFLTYRLGGSMLHGLISIGSNWKDGNVHTRIGFGNLTRIKGDFYLQSALYWNNSHYYNGNKKWDTSYQDNWTTLSCGLVYYWGEKVGIKVAPNFNLWNEYIGHDWDENWFSYDLGVDVGLSIRL